jgi:hypothetical protein
MKSYKEFKEGFAHPNHKKLDANYNGKLDADDFKLLRKKKQSTKEDCSMKEDHLPESLADDLMKIKGVKPRGSVADQKAARDALIAKRKETNPNPPQLGSSSSDKYKLGDYDKKSNRSYSEEVELEEAHKIGSKVTIHKGTGTGIVGHIGEIRRKHKGDTNPSYTIFYGDRDAIRASKSQIKAVKESVEQIDELSKKTLGSYIKKATSDVGLAGFVKGTTVNDHSRSKDYEDAAAMNRKRKMGIGSAVRKLTKESVEQIDEISKKTLGSYVKKATSDVGLAGFVKGTTVNDHSRSKDYDDAAAMNRKRKMGIAKAVDKLTKESVELEEAIVKLDVKKVITKYPKLKDYGISSITMVNGELHIVSDYSIKPAGISDSQIIGAASTTYPKKVKESVELYEKLDPFMGAGEYVKDFKKSDAPQFKGKSPEKRRIMGVAAFLDAQRKIKEEVELKEARKEPAQVYHPTYSSAVQHARANAEKQGYTVSDDDWFHHVNSGPGKPSGGKTTRHVIPLQKDGKPSKKALAIQVHDRQTDKNSYELNSYIN